MKNDMFLTKTGWTRRGSLISTYTHHINHSPSGCSFSYVMQTNVHYGIRSVSLEGYLPARVQECQ